MQGGDSSGGGMEEGTGAYHGFLFTCNGPICYLTLGLYYFKIYPHSYFF